MESLTAPESSFRVLLGVCRGPSGRPTGRAGFQTGSIGRFRKDSRKGERRKEGSSTLQHHYYCPPPFFCGEATELLLSTPPPPPPLPFLRSNRGKKQPRVHTVEWRGGRECVLGGRKEVKEGKEPFRTPPPPLLPRTASVSSSQFGLALKQQRKEDRSPPTPHPHFLPFSPFWGSEGTKRKREREREEEKSWVPCFHYYTLSVPRGVGGRKERKANVIWEQPTGGREVRTYRSSYGFCCCCC